MLNEFIAKLGKNLNWEQPLEANDDASYSLQLEPDINVRLKEDGQTILLQTKLAPMPAQNAEVYLLKAMSANLFGNETGGAFLGLDGEGQKVVLMDVLFEVDSYRTFHDRLEDFVNYADAWRKETLDMSKKPKEPGR